MVSIEDLLKRVQQAETETDRQWVLLELQMSQMPGVLVSMLWAAAIPHFFDAKVLAALRPELVDQAEGLYADLGTLTFVEEFPGHGCNIHELTRGVLLSQLWQQNREEFLRLSKRAADYFFDKRTSSEEDVEFCYHEILNEGNAQTGRLLDRGIDWWTYYQLDRSQAALQGFSEHEKAGRLDAFGRGFLLHLQGLVKSGAANYKEAELCFSRAQAIYENIKLKNPRYLTTLLRDLSSSKSHQGSDGSAVPICEQSLRICEAQLGENHPDTATSLNNLASLYQEIGRQREAEPLYLRALKIYEAQLGENHPTTASNLNNLALLYQATGRQREAEPLFLRALKIWEAQLGENHPTTATSLNNLASLYQATGRQREAEPLFLRALKIWEAQLGENHPTTATSLNNLALLYKDIGRYQEAEPLFLRDLKICEDQLEENHPDTAITLSNLASLYQEQERYSEAIPLLERWKNIKRERQETQNQYFAERIRTLGKLYERVQRFPEAVAAYEEALSRFNQVFGSNHPRALVLKGELGRLKKRINSEAKRDK